MTDAELGDWQEKIARSITYTTIRALVAHVRAEALEPWIAYQNHWGNCEQCRLTKCQEGYALFVAAREEAGNGS